MSVDNVSLLFRGARFFSIFIFLCLFERLNPNYIYYIINTAIYATSFGSRRLSPYRRPPHGVRFFFTCTYNTTNVSPATAQHYNIYGGRAMCVRFSLYFISNVSRIIYTTYGGSGAYGLNGLLGQIDFPVAIVCFTLARVCVCGFRFVFTA